MGKVKSKGLPLRIPPDGANDSPMYHKRMIEEAKDFEIIKNGVDVGHKMSHEKKLPSVQRVKTLEKKLPSVQRVKNEIPSGDSDSGEMIEMIEYSSSHRLRTIQMLPRTVNDEQGFRFSPYSNDMADFISPICRINNGKGCTQNENSCGKQPSEINLVKNLFVSEMSKSWQLLGSVNESFVDEDSEFAVLGDRTRDHCRSVSFSEEGSVLIDPAELSSTEEIMSDLGEGRFRQRLNPVYSSDEISLYEDSLNDSLPLSELCASGFQLPYHSRKKYLYDASCSTESSNDSSLSSVHLPKKEQILFGSPLQSGIIRHPRQSSSSDGCYSIATDDYSACLDNENPSITSSDNSSIDSSVISSPDCVLPEGCGMSVPLGNAFSGFLTQYETLVQVQTGNMEMNQVPLPEGPDSHDNGAHEKQSREVIEHISDIDNVGKNEPRKCTPSSLKHVQDVDKQTCLSEEICNDVPQIKPTDRRKSILLSAADSVEEDTIWSSIKTAKAKLKSMKKRLLSSAEAQLFLNSPIPKNFMACEKANQKYNRRISGLTHSPNEDQQDCDTVAKKLAADVIHNALLELSGEQSCSVTTEEPNVENRLSRIESGQGDAPSKSLFGEVTDTPCPALQNLAHILASNAIETAMEDLLPSYEPNQMDLPEGQALEGALSDVSSRTTEQTFLEDSNTSTGFERDLDSPITSSGNWSENEIRQMESMSEEQEHGESCRILNEGHLSSLSSRNSNVAEALPVPNQIDCICVCDEDKVLSPNHCDDVFTMNICNTACQSSDSTDLNECETPDKDVVELCRSFGTLRIVSDGTPPTNHSVLPSLGEKDHGKLYSEGLAPPSSVIVSSCEYSQNSSQVCQDTICPREKFASSKSTKSSKDPTVPVEGQWEPSKDKDGEQCGHDDGSEIFSDAGLESEETLGLGKDARNQQLDSLLHQIRNYRMRKNLPIRSRSTGTIPCTTSASRDRIRAFSTNSQPNVGGDARSERAQTATQTQLQAVSKATKLTQTEFEVQEEEKQAARVKLGSYERDQWREHQIHEDLLKRHLKQFHDLIKVQPRRHTEEQLRRERKCQLNEEKKQDLEELYRLRHQKRLEFLKKQSCSLSPDGSTKQSETKPGEQETLQQETPGGEHFIENRDCIERNCLDLNRSIDDQVFAESDSAIVHDQEIRPQARGEMVSEVASTGTWAELEDEIYQLVSNNPGDFVPESQKDSEIPFGSFLPSDGPSVLPSASIYNSSWVPYTGKSSSSLLSNVADPIVKSAQVDPTGWGFHKGSSPCLVQPTLRSNTAPFDNSGSPPAVYTRYGQPVHGWWANSPSLHVDYYGYIGRGSGRVTLPLAGGGMWQSVTLRKAASEECDSSTDDVFLKESCSQLIDINGLPNNGYTQQQVPQTNQAKTNFSSIWDVSDGEVEGRNCCLPFTRYQNGDQPKLEGLVSENREPQYWDHQNKVISEKEVRDVVKCPGKDKEAESGLFETLIENGMPASCGEQPSLGATRMHETKKEEFVGVDPSNSSVTMLNKDGYVHDTFPCRFIPSLDTDENLPGDPKFSEECLQYEGINVPDDSSNSYIPRYGPMAVRARRVSGEKTGPAFNKDVSPLMKEEITLLSGNKRQACVSKSEVEFSQNRYSGSNTISTREIKPGNRTAFQKLPVSTLTEESSSVKTDSKQNPQTYSGRAQFRRTPGNERKLDIGPGPLTSSAMEKCHVVKTDFRQCHQGQNEKAPFRKTPGNGRKGEVWPMKANSTRMEDCPFVRGDHSRGHQVFRGKTPFRKAPGKEIICDTGPKQSTCSMPSISEMDEWTEELEADQYFILDTRQPKSIYLDVEDKPSHTLHNSKNAFVDKGHENSEVDHNEVFAGKISERENKQMSTNCERREHMSETEKCFNKEPKVLPSDNCTSFSGKTTMNNQGKKVPNDKGMHTNHNWKHKLVYHNNSCSNNTNLQMGGNVKPAEANLGSKYGPRRIKRNSRESPEKNDDFVQNSHFATYEPSRSDQNSKSQLQEKSNIDNSIDYTAQGSKCSSSKERCYDLERNNDRRSSQENRNTQLLKDDYQPKKKEFRNRKRQTRGYLQGTPKSKKVAPNEEKQPFKKPTSLPAVTEECEEEWIPPTAFSRNNNVSSANVNKSKIGTSQNRNHGNGHTNADPSLNQTETIKKCPGHKREKPKKKRRLGKTNSELKEVPSELKEDETPASEALRHVKTGRSENSVEECRKRRSRRSFINSQISRSDQSGHVPSNTDNTPVDTGTDPNGLSEERQETENPRNRGRERNSNSQPAPRRKTNFKQNPSLPPRLQKKVQEEMAQKEEMVNQKVAAMKEKSRAIEDRHKIVRADALAAKNEECPARR